MNDLNSVVENIKHGDTNGWSVVYQTYYNKLYRHALSLTDNDPQNAQDAVQGAFARAMSDNRIQTLKDNDKLFQWLSTFVLNEVRPMWRKQEKFMAFSTAEDYENTIDGIADDDICIPEDYAIPLSTAIALIALERSLASEITDRIGAIIPNLRLTTPMFSSDSSGITMPVKSNSSCSVISEKPCKSLFQTGVVLLIQSITKKLSSSESSTL